jgi:hypothetical protein
MLENNCVIFWVQLISGTWPHDYNDSYVYTEYLKATLNGKNKIKTAKKYAKTTYIISTWAERSRSYVSRDSLVTMYTITKHKIKVTKILPRQASIHSFVNWKVQFIIAHHDWMLRKNCFSGLKHMPLLHL